MGVQWFVESGLFKCLQHPDVLLLCAQMRILQAYQEVLPDCTTFHESEVLKQEGNLITTQKHGLPAVGSGNPSAEEADCSGLEVLQQADDVKKSLLAAAARTEDGCDFVCGNGQGKV